MIKESGVKRVQRGELLDYLTYGERREAIRASAMAAKEVRRVHAGEHLTFLFENTETQRYQIQEMIRVEQLVREQDIVHELDTYNALLGEEGDLGCTLLLEIEDEEVRADLLHRWRDLPGHVFLRLEDGRAVPAHWDEGQIGEEKLSSVQFLLFAAGRGARPAGLVVNHPALALEVMFSRRTGEALAEDLA